MTTLHAPRFSRTFLPVVLLAMTMLTGLLGCEQTIKVSDKDIQQITYRQLNELLNSNAKPDEVVLVDVRSAVKFNNGHIPGAININLPDLTASEPRLAKSKHIIVYGGGWSDALSRAAGKRLLAFGYKGVREFQGGITAWQNEGRMLAVIRDVPTSDATGDVKQDAK